jgi:protein CpxP
VPGSEQNKRKSRQGQRPRVTPCDGSALCKVKQSFVQILFSSQLPTHKSVPTQRHLVWKKKKEIPMRNRHLPVLLAAALIAATASFAAAQDSQPNNQPPQQEKGGWRHGPPPDAAERTQELTKKLSLTSDQQTKVQDIFQSEHTQMESLRQDTSLSQQDRRNKMMDIHKSTGTQVRALLDSTQQKKWDEMQAKREQWGHKGGGEQQGPPPQL